MAEDFRGAFRCLLELSFSSEEEASVLLQSVKMEDGDYIRSELDGCSITAEAEAENIPSLLHTLNDYLACISAADRVILHHRRENQHPL